MKSKGYLRLVVVCSLSACSTGTQSANAPPAEETPAEEQVEEGAVPWAPGTGPGATREVGEQPRSSDEPMPDFAAKGTGDDGVAQAGAVPGCAGRVPPQLRLDVQNRIAALSSCNELAPADYRGEGILRYTLRVESDGRVKTIYQLEDTLKLPRVTTCVESKLREPFSAGPSGGCAQFVVPYELAVKESQESADPTHE